MSLANRIDIHRRPHRKLHKKIYTIKATLSVDKQEMEEENDPQADDAAPVPARIPSVNNKVSLRCPCFYLRLIGDHHSILELRRQTRTIGTTEIERASMDQVVRNFGLGSAQYPEM